MDEIDPPPELLTRLEERLDAEMLAEARAGSWLTRLWFALIGGVIGFVFGLSLQASTPLTGFSNTDPYHRAEQEALAPGALKTPDIRRLLAETCAETGKDALVFVLQQSKRDQPQKTFLFPCIF